jgi:uncharacterized protein (DUF2225 family)
MKYMILSEILERYPQSNNEWGLHTYNFGNSTSLGKRISWMYNELMVNCGIDTIPNDVIYSINSLDSVTTYFVRTKLTHYKFVGDDVYYKLAPFNSDPWNREFLVYYGNVIHPQYAHIKNRDGWQKAFISVYFNNMVAKYSGMHNNDNVPLMVLYVTTVDKKDVYCLDIIST